MIRLIFIIGFALIFIPIVYHLIKRTLSKWDEEIQETNLEDDVNTIKNKETKLKNDVSDSEKEMIKHQKMIEKIKKERGLK